MRGKTQPITRFNKFKENILTRFSNSKREPGRTPLSHFIHYLEYNASASFEGGIALFCDKDGTLKFDESNFVTSLYQLLRIADKPVLLRDLENFGEVTWGKSIAGKIAFYTAISVLIGTNLVNYNVDSNRDSIEDSLMFFIDEWDD